MLASTLARNNGIAAATDTKDRPVRRWFSGVSNPVAAMIRRTANSEAERPMSVKKAAMRLTVQRSPIA
jgi:hypothetical protein